MTRSHLSDHFKIVKPNSSAVLLTSLTFFSSQKSLIYIRNKRKLRHLFGDRSWRFCSYLYKGKSSFSSRAVSASGSLLTHNSHLTDFQSSMDWQGTHAPLKYMWSEMWWETTRHRLLASNLNSKKRHWSTLIIIYNWNKGGRFYQEKKTSAKEGTAQVCYDWNQ